MSDINPEFKNTLDKKTIEKLQGLQEEYKKIISPNHYHNRLQEGKRQQDIKQRVELYKYNNGLSDTLNDYIKENSGKDMIAVIKNFMENVVDSDKNKKINIEAFKKGYEAIHGNVQITELDMDELLNADLPEDLRIDTLDCKTIPLTCNYKYFLKSFYSLLNKRNKIELLTYLLLKVKNNDEGSKGVNAYVDRSKEPAMTEQKVIEVIDEKEDIATMSIDKVVSIFKTLRNKDIQRSLKSRFQRDVVNYLRATCYNRLHYHLNQDILRLEHTFNTLKNWHKTKHKPKINTKKPTKAKESEYNSTRRRSYYLNKEYALLRQTYYNIKPETKKRKKEYYANYKNKIQDKELYRRKNNLRTQIYRLLNKERVNGIIQRYNLRKKGKMVSRVVNS
jgi:hypothetical protein